VLVGGGFEILDDKVIATPPEGGVAMALVVDRHVPVAGPQLEDRETG
jgi:hypothetical protein